MTMEPICALKEVYKQLYKFEKEFSAENDITINEAMLLCCMKDGKERSAGEIYKYIGLSASRGSKIITAAEKKGFLVRSIAKADHRQMLFKLSAIGKKKVEQMQKSKVNTKDLYNGILNMLK
mgnify:FL=1|jgi:DNA-binding MarR family transcriptional regulator